MKWCPVLISLLIVACASSEIPLQPVPPDLAGWTPLPMENLRIERQGERHVITVETTTSSPGWEVALLPYGYNRSPRVFTLSLVGKLPTGANPPQAVTRVSTRKTLVLEARTLFVEIVGQNGTYTASVPWMPSGE